MCEPVISYSSIGSFFFIGYSIGVVFFFVPDTIGRKGSMKWFIPLYTYGAYLSTFSTNLNDISLGLFIMGFFHHKSNLTYTHGVELVCDKYTNLIPTIINSWEVSLFMQMGLFYKYYSRDAQLFLNISFVVGLINCVLYLLLIPESPKWLFMKKGSNSQEAIAVLNYIAWFNSSTFTVPNDAYFDVLG